MIRTVLHTIYLHLHLHLLSKESSYSSQDAILLRIIWVIFARNLEQRRECRSVSIDSVAYPLSNLPTISNKPSDMTRSPTCWLINKIPMSFLSDVNLSKASSIAALSVLLSTTKKFFCESGGAVTCYTNQYIIYQSCREHHTPIPAKSRPVTES